MHCVGNYLRSQTTGLFKEKDQYLLPYCVITTIDHVKRVEGRLTESARYLARRAHVGYDSAPIFCEFPVLQPIGLSFLNVTDLTDGIFEILNV